MHSKLVTAKSVEHMQQLGCFIDRLMSVANIGKLGSLLCSGVEVWTQSVDINLVK